MPYRFKRKESVPEGIRRIAREEVAKAVATIEGDGIPAEQIHDARTRCKKLRGLLRLVRPHLGETYSRENTFLRDAARPLSAARDAVVILKAFEDLARRDRFDPVTDEAVRRVLTPSATEDDDSQRLAVFTAEIRMFNERIEEWRLDARGFAAIEEGLTDTYRRGRAAMHRALETGADTDRHEWRKQAKYHWYHVRLLRNVWKPAMDARRTELERLSDLLGDDHDLAVLRETLHAATRLDPRHTEPVFTAIDRRRTALSSSASPLGSRLYAEKPRAFSKRMKRYWKTRRSA